MSEIGKYTNKIIQGDCINLMKDLPDNSVDLVFADPPYNLQLEDELYRPNQTKVDAVNDDWDDFSSFKEYDYFTKNWLEECKRILKNDGSIWVIGSYHNIFRVGKLMQDLGFWILNDILWIKTNPMPNFKGTRFNNAHETLIWASKNKDSAYNFHYKSMKAFNTGKQMRSDWYIPLCNGKERLKVNGEKLHSTQKPEDLLYRVILSSSDKGDIVLDPFMGSGTTGAVAKRLGRKYIGFEKEEKYVQAARERIDNTKAIHQKHLSNPIENRKPRVPFGNLITKGLIDVGEKVYSKNKKYSAEVSSDGSLIWKNKAGSIHGISAEILNKKRNNGWYFWHVERDDELICINDLREKYREKYIDQYNETIYGI